MQEDLKTQYSEQSDPYFDFFVKEVNKRKELLQKENPNKEVKLNFTPLQKQLGWKLDFVLTPKKIS